jgi:hypothetical protein
MWLCVCVWLCACGCVCVWLCACVRACVRVSASRSYYSALQAAAESIGIAPPNLSVHMQASAHARPTMCTYEPTHAVHACACVGLTGRWIAFDPLCHTCERARRSCARQCGEGRGVSVVRGTDAALHTLPWQMLAHMNQHNHSNRVYRAAAPPSQGQLGTTLLHHASTVHSHACRGLCRMRVIAPAAAATGAPAIAGMAPSQSQKYAAAATHTHTHARTFVPQPT